MLYKIWSILDLWIEELCGRLEYICIRYHHHLNSYIDRGLRLHLVFYSWNNNRCSFFTNLLLYTIALTSLYSELAIYKDISNNINASEPRFKSDRILHYNRVYMYLRCIDKTSRITDIWYHRTEYHRVEYCDSRRNSSTCKPAHLIYIIIRPNRSYQSDHISCNYEYIHVL